MPTEFPDMSSLVREAEARGCRKPFKNEPEDQYREVLADHVSPADIVESQEIRSKVAWDKWDESQKAQFLTLLLKRKGPSSARVRLFHLTSFKGGEEIRKNGGFQGSVLLKDKPPDENVSAIDNCLSLFLMHEDEVRTFERIGDSKDCPEWLVPAELVNRSVKDEYGRCVVETYRGENYLGDAPDFEFEQCTRFALVTILASRNGKFVRVCKKHQSFGESKGRNVT